jgi:hypothetical protein
MKKLYEVCEFCSGTGHYLPHGDGRECPCCKLLRVAEIGITLAQAESLSRELARRDLRIAGLTRELQAATARAASVSAVPDVGALPLGDVLAWLEAAPDLALLQIRNHCAALLEMRSEDRLTVSLDGAGGALTGGG